MRNFFYRLMFTKGDEMDLSQFYLLALNILFIVWVVNISMNLWFFSQEMLDAFLIIYGTTVVLSSPTWLVKLWLENQSWFRRNATGAVSSAKAAATNFIAPVETPVAMVDEAVPSTDVSEMNHAGVLPAVAPTEFPLPEEPAADSPTNRAWVG